jgi:hypothetical protein
VRADKEQCQGTFHGHCLALIEGFDEVQESFFGQDPLKHNAT